VTGPTFEVRTWRAIRGRRAALIAALAVLLGAAILGAALPAPFQGGDKIGVALMGIPVAAVLLLLARPSVTASEEGLVVRNLVGTRRLSWAEVVSIRLGPDDSWASIDVSDGTSLAVMALQTADRTHTAAALDDLRRRLVDAESRD
jgi:Bacterial PH domain